MFSSLPDTTGARRAVVAVHAATAQRTRDHALLVRAQTRLAAGDLRRADALAERAGRATKTPATRVACLHVRGNVALRRAQFDHAEVMLRESVDLARTLPNAALLIATGLNLLGVLYKFSGRYDEARDAYDAACAELRNADLADDPLMITLLHNRGGLDFSIGNFDDGLVAATESVRLRTAGLGADHPAVALDIAARASLLAQQGNLDEAARDYTTALASIEHALGREHYEWAVTVNNLGVVEARRGDYGRAETLLRAALRAKERTWGNDSPEVGVTLVNLSDLCARVGRRDDARPFLMRAAAIAASVPRTHPLAVAIAQRRDR